MRVKRSGPDADPPVMWRPDLTGRPQGTALVACVSSAVVSSAGLIAAVALLIAGYAGLTLIMLPIVLVLAIYATYLLESSLRRHAAAAGASTMAPSPVASGH